MTDVTLVVPFGADDTPVAHGTTDYQPHIYRADITDPNSLRLVVVPLRVAEYLCHNAGFYPMAQESEPNFTGEARLYAPYGCSWNGVQYHPNADDIVVVPSAAVADLLAFPPICPEAQRPDQLQLPTPDHVSGEQDKTVRRLKEQGRAEMQAELDAHRHERDQSEPAKVEGKSREIRKRES